MSVQYNTDLSREGARAFLVSHGVPAARAEEMLNETENTQRTVHEGEAAVAYDDEPGACQGYTAVSSLFDTAGE